MIKKDQNVETVKVEARIVVMVSVAILYYFFAVWKVYDVTDGKPFEAIGVAGDFIGGLTNPLISLVAVLLLMRTYQLQKTELKSTSTALIDAASDAKRQANISLIQSKVQILISALEGKRASVSHLNEEIRRIANVIDPPGQAALVLSLEGQRLSGIREREGYLGRCVEQVTGLHEDIECLTDELTVHMGMLTQLQVPTGADA